MAARQQQQLEAQHQLLVARQQRLRFLQAQDASRQQVAAEAERLRRLRDRVEAQEAKLARLRALRGQVDQQRNNNGNLTSDLESIRALFNEKEKELALAVARVEQLTSQLEEIRHTRHNTNPLSPAAIELERLRRELTYRQRLNEQQNQRMALQRAAVGQRQDELARIDQRIAELQARLHRKRLLNQQLAQQISAATAAKQAMLVPGAAPVGARPRPLPLNVAAVEPFTRSSSTKEVGSGGVQSHQTQDDLHTKLGPTQFAPNKNDPKYQTLPYNTKFPKSIPGRLLSRDEEENQIPVEEEGGKEEKTDEGSLGFCKDGGGRQGPAANGANATMPPRPFGSSYTNIMNPNHHSTQSDVNGNSFLPGSNVVVVQQKPVSSVAPTSLTPPKTSTIYQTSSTRITPLQPHTLSSTPQGILQEVHDSASSHPRPPKPALPPKPTVPIKPTPPPRQTAPYPPERDHESSFLSSGRPPAALPPTETPKNLVPPTTPENENFVGERRKVSLSRRRVPPVQVQVQQGMAKSNVASVQPSRRDGVQVHLQVASRGKEQEEGVEEEEEDRGEAVIVDETDRAPVEEMKEAVMGEKDVEEKGVEEGLLEVHPSPAESISPTSAPQYLSLVQRVKKGNLKTRAAESGRQVLRRVSFDPLALLLDAALEGELELVRKTAQQVPNPSAANDEGITALHNAICAGHFDIVRFLVEFGCDVNAQDSDGWTPLHCAASCNNLPMVKFLVEHGACIFATTLSDHETAAEKCEEDEEGFDGCSEYLYSIQEKLGILNGGGVYAVYEYEAQNPDELNFHDGDKLVVLHKGDEYEREWWWSRLSDKEGYIPRNLLGLYPRVQSQKDEKN